MRSLCKILKGEPEKSCPLAKGEKKVEALGKKVLIENA